jgi:DNA-binding LytR/AlgR family response regulator
LHSIKVLAVEDDDLHADVLRMVIDQLGYELIDVVDNPADALRLLGATRPDVLLMDIDLGGEETGIDLVRKVNEVADVPVIYVTSFREESIFKAARETMPEAYLNKPYDPVNLRAAIELAVFRRQQEATQVREQKPGQPAATTVFVKEGNNLVKLLLRDVVLVEAYDKYCFVYTRGKKHLLSLQLKHLLQHLPPEQFLQVHRSYVVNLEAIDGVRPAQNSLEVAGKLIPVSKTYKNALFARITLL